MCGFSKSEAGFEFSTEARRQHLSSIPRCAKQLIRLRLIKALALSHLDYILPLWHFMASNTRKLIQSAANRVLQRCLGLHLKCSGEMVCCVAGLAPTPIRAGHLSVSLKLKPCLNTDTLAVLRLHRNALKGKLAAFAVANDVISQDHADRADCIRDLLRSSEACDRRLAYFISVPTALA